MNKYIEYVIKLQNFNTKLHKFNLVILEAILKRDEINYQHKYQIKFISIRIK